jgi:hypothetical protein
LFSLLLFFEAQITDSLFIFCLPFLDTGARIPSVVIQFEGEDYVYTACEEWDESYLTNLPTEASMAADIQLEETAWPPKTKNSIDSDIFFGPLSSFMRLLQLQFRIESDVSLEFDALSLSIPINMGFATTSLSLAHLFAIASAANDESTDESFRSNILKARLLVEPTNFVKKYNELVQNMKWKQSLSIASSPVAQKRKKLEIRVDSTNLDSSSPDDDAASVKSTRSRASSTWSHLAVQDALSVAVLSDSESYGFDLEWEASKRSFVPAASSNSSRRVRRHQSFRSRSSYGGDSHNDLHTVPTERTLFGSNRDGDIMSQDGRHPTSDFQTDVELSVVDDDSLSVASLDMLRPPSSPPLLPLSSSNLIHSSFIPPLDRSASSIASFSRSSISPTQLQPPSQSRKRPRASPSSASNTPPLVPSNTSQYKEEHDSGDEALEKSAGISMKRAKFGDGPAT